MQTKRISSDHFKLKLNEVDESNYKILQLKRNYGNHEVSRCPNQYWSQKDLDLEENPPMGALWCVWENTNQELLQKRFFTVDKVQQNYSKANIWSCNNNYQVSQCPNQYWSQEDLDMEENPPMGALLSKNCYRKVFHCGQNTNTNIIGKLCKTRERITQDDVSWSLISHLLNSLALWTWCHCAPAETPTRLCTTAIRVEEDFHSVAPGRYDWRQEVSGIRWI